MNVIPSQPDATIAEGTAKPVRSGSLPFKKRRFPRLALSLLCDDGGNEAIENIVAPRDTAHTADKFAALALIAAAASTGEDTDVLSSVSTEATGTVPKKHGFSFYPHEGEKPSSTQTATLSSALVAAAVDLQSLHDVSPASTTDGTSPKRNHRLPLKSPLPNGCHGRTSRNNSYCRRNPCYNGSKYCKLHYQHCIVSGAATDKELMAGLVVDAGEFPEDGTMGGALDANKAVPSGQVSVNHQDKRYTGAVSEVRCKATTTRGRECSYCAVNGTKYCYLHADYDTNPPPRRGGASATVTNVKGKEGGIVPEVAKTDQTPVNSRTGKAGKSDGAKRKSPSMSARRLSTTKNLEKHMADAPYPLLSTLATDKWLNRKVIVSTGPLTNHVGLVEKWGNGWVSVRLPGVGLHNRRSFELYLHPSGDTGNGKDDKAAPVVEVFDSTKERPPAEKGFTDGNSGSTADKFTPPTPLASHKPVLDPKLVHEVTPLTSCRVIGVDQNVSRGETGTRRMSSIMFPACMSSSPSTVPESPVPSPGSSDTILSDPVKGPGEPANGEVPLIQSLLVAQEGRAANHKLGLLFGTAALERSRRNISKPVRYEDTELIAKKLKKRDRDTPGAGDWGEAVKRKCAKAHVALEGSSNSTSIVSSSDEEESSGVTLSMVSV